MNTAAELRKFKENQALEKAIKAVSDALANAPFGLEISQIMNNCRLSNKTTKNVLSIIRAENQNGVWCLGGSITPEIQSVSPQPKEIEKVENMPTTSVQDSEPKVQSYIKRMIELFKNNPAGISLHDALQVLGGERGRFDRELIRVRRNHFPVELKTVGLERLYIPHLDNKPEAVIEKTPATPVKPQPQKIHIADPKLSIPDAQADKSISEKVIEFRSMVQKHTVITEEVLLNSDQLDNVLKDIFGLDTVSWSQVDGKVQVHLTKTQVA